MVPGGDETLWANRLIALQRDDRLGGNRVAYGSVRHRDRVLLCQVVRCRRHPRNDERSHLCTNNNGHVGSNFAVVNDDNRRLRGSGIHERGNEQRSRVRDADHVRAGTDELAPVAHHVSPLGDVAALVRQSLIVIH